MKKEAKNTLRFTWLSRIVIHYTTTHNIYFISCEVIEMIVIIEWLNLWWMYLVILVPQDFWEKRIISRINTQRKWQSLGTTGFMLGYNSMYKVYHGARGIFYSLESSLSLPVVLFLYITMICLVGKSLMTTDIFLFHCSNVESGYFLLTMIPSSSSGSEIFEISILERKFVHFHEIIWNLGALAHPSICLHVRQIL